MNTNIQTITLCLLLAVGVWLPLKAETGDAARMEVGQQFSAGGTVLPAGQYLIRVVATNSDQPLLSIESVNGASAILVSARHCELTIGQNLSQASNQGGATFSKRQNQMHLIQVWFGGRLSGYELLGAEK